MKQCSASGCERAAVARGLCKKHHKRLMRHGDPERGRIKTPLGIRLIKHIDAVTAVNNCWNWTGAKDRFGYGLVGDDSSGKWRSVRAHIASWTWAKGPPPEGMCVLHHCDNPSCINPNHLFIGTKADNVADMDAKGRRRTVARSCADHPMARLTVQEIDEIRERYAAAPKSRGERKAPGAVATIARDYGIKSSYVIEIAQGRRWAGEFSDKMLPGEML